MNKKSCEATTDCPRIVSKIMNESKSMDTKMQKEIKRRGEKNKEKKVVIHLTQIRSKLNKTQI